MAKLNDPKSKKIRSSTSKFNAIGYAKRRSRKESSLTDARHEDVYEYQPEKIRHIREKVTLELGRDEAAEWGNLDEEGDTESPRARLVEENEKIASEDDEDIDSDDAFEESDEERFAGFNFSQKKKPSNKSKSVAAKPRVRFTEVNLNEDEGGSSGEEEYGKDENEEDEDESEMEDEEDGDEDEFIDVLDVLDGKGEVEDSHEALEALGNFISSLDAGKKRKADEAEAIQLEEGERQTRKRRVIEERTEAGLENAFSAQTSSSSKLKLDDLLAPLASQSSNLLSLKKSVKPLASTSGVKTLAAPLPQRTQERLDREAAYEQTKEEVGKWSDTMKRIREADHLSFPLQVEPEGKVSNLELIAKFKPITELETSIDHLLKSAKMRDEDIPATEALKTQHLSVEEVSTRRAELRRMRELMFRAELKARRVAKIKSKAYRRIKKKEREKMAAKLDEGEDEDSEEARLKRDVERARERATLRHKNTGKWAKAMKNRGELDVDQRQEITEMLDRGEQLRRKIHGKGSEDEDDDEDDESEGNEGDLDDIKASAFSELTSIRRVDEDEDAEAASMGKGVFGMKFMKDAAMREQVRTSGMIDDFAREMGGMSASDDDVEGTGGEADSAAVQRAGGRVVFRPGTTSTKLYTRPIGSLASDTSSVTLKSTDLLALSPPPDSQPTLLSHVALPALPEETNPWLVPQDDVTSKAPRKNEVLVGKDSTGAVKSKNKLKKLGRKLTEEQDKVKDDAMVEISMENVITSGPSNRVKEKEKTEIVGDESDSNSELEEQEKALDRKRKRKAGDVKAFEQRDLVVRAFAGDNVVQSFEEAKRREIAADAPREVDTTLPGWGSWGGSGTKRPVPKPHLIKKIAGVDPASRADYKKAHVIISERRDKKAAKYLVKDLPYPYTSVAQFERSMDIPIGTEWNTRVGFQRGTLPKVVKKMGVVINPLEKPL